MVHCVERERQLTCAEEVPFHFLPRLFKLNQPFFKRLKSLLARATAEGPAEGTLLCMEPDYYLRQKLLTAALFTADGHIVYVLKLLECEQLPLSFSHKNP